MGDAAVSTSEDAAEAQLSSRPVHTLFNQERHLVTRQVYEQRRSAALAEWRTHAADRRLQASRSRNAQTPPLL
jgi:hypothetical protein